MLRGQARRGLKEPVKSWLRFATAHQSIMADFEAVCERELGAVLEFVGPSQHLYICGVNRGFHAHYHKAKDEAGVVQCKTSHKAAFESVSRLTLALQCGLQLKELHYKAGRYASIGVLQAAQTLGLRRFSADVLGGAARSGHLTKLQWLVEEQDLGLHTCVAREAAKGGSVEMMQWLQAEGVSMTAAVMYNAAIDNQIAIVPYLRSVGTPWSQGLPSDVAESGHFEMLKMIMDMGCPVGPGEPAGMGQLAYFACQSNSFDISEWLVIEHDVVLADTDAVSGAAYHGHLSLMRWLIDQHGCDVTADVCHHAILHAVNTGSLDTVGWLLQRHSLLLSPDLHSTAFGYFVGNIPNHMKVMRWLREVADCPWAAAELAIAAIVWGDLESLKYIHQHGGPFNAEQLHAQLQRAYHCQELAEWLRAQGAE